MSNTAVFNAPSAAPAAAHQLALHNVEKSFKRVRALETVQLEVPRGEFLSLLGPSGCGKTTTLNIIAGFVRPDTGHVYLRGKDVTRVPSHRRGLAMVFQGASMFPHMNAFDNVAFGLRVRKLSRTAIQARVTSALDLVHLSSHAQRFSRELSGGEQQRVALARALVVDPDLFLLDEPLSALDANLRHAMQVEIRALHDRLGLTSIYVTHDQQEAFALSDRVAVMNKGRIEQIATPSELYKTPRTRFIATFIGAANVIDGTVVEVQSDCVIVELASRDRIVVSNRNHTIKAGAVVSLVVREEQMRLVTARESINSFPARLLRSVFQGASLRHFTEASGYEWRVLGPPAQQFKTDQELYVTMRPEDVLLLEEP
jgi:ABC-type Fe3+/spermidine/putrescine transport system ATPase subunit